MIASPPEVELCVWVKLVVLAGKLEVGKAIDVVMELVVEHVVQLSKHVVQLRTTEFALEELAGTLVTTARGVVTAGMSVVLGTIDTLSNVVDPVRTTAVVLKKVDKHHV